MSWVDFCVKLISITTLTKPIHSCSWCAVKLLLWNVSLSEHWFPMQHPVLSRSSTELLALGACCAAASNILWCPNQEVVVHLCVLDYAQFLCSLEMTYLPDWVAQPWRHLVPLKPIWKCPWISISTWYQWFFSLDHTYLSRSELLTHSSTITVSAKLSKAKWMGWCKTAEHSFEVC